MPCLLSRQKDVPVKAKLDMMWEIYNDVSLYVSAVLNKLLKVIVLDEAQGAVGWDLLFSIF